MKFYRLAGTVVGDEDASWLEMLEVEHISAKGIYKLLNEANGEDITFNLNSGGGSVMAGSEIYTMLKDYSGRVTVNITGLSASIASVFMMGADEVNISHQAQIMIHQPRVGVYGSIDNIEAERIKGMLDSTERSLASVYIAKTGLSEEKIMEMMFKETWLTAKEAKELGFVDNILNVTEDTAPVAEQMVAMVQSAGNQLELLKEIKNMKGSNMEKTFLEKVRGLLNSTTTEVEETVVEESATVEEATNEEPEEEEPVIEESVTVDDSETTALLEKAINEIEALRAENAELKTKVGALEATNEQLTTDNASLTAKDAKSKEVVAKLNALLDSEEAKVVTVSQQTKPKNSQFPEGYNGIRGGNI